MGYFQVRYNSRVVIYHCRGFIRLATDGGSREGPHNSPLNIEGEAIDTYDHIITKQCYTTIFALSGNW